MFSTQEGLPLGSKFRLPETQLKPTTLLFGKFRPFGHADITPMQKSMQIYFHSDKSIFSTDTITLQI